MGSPIDWSSKESHVFVNPRTPVDEYNHLKSLLEKTAIPHSHICILTSGTSGKKKWVLLSKNAFLVSAEAVNSHIEAKASDRWINCLPLFHVGGLSIYARAFLSGSSVVDLHGDPWDAKRFSKAIDDHYATLTSLVPTQVYDIASHSLRAPPSLRAVFIGGSSLSQELYFQAAALGWPLLPTYGMTECCSQIATAPLFSWKENRYPSLKPLNHVKTRINDQGLLEISSGALLTAYVMEGKGFYDPKKEGWLTTEDCVTLGDEGISQISRGNGFVKIGGENVDLQRLQGILEDVRVSLRFPHGVAVGAAPDTRRGNSIELLVEGPVDDLLKELIDNYHKRVLPFERITNIRTVEKIPRTPLGKIIQDSSS